MTNTPNEIVYTARATVKGGREAGHARSEDGILDLQLTAPTETGGPGTGTNPEQLFAVGYGACFQTAVDSVAEAFGVDDPDSTVEVSVNFGPDDTSFALTVDIVATIAGTDDETAQSIVDKAHEKCPYSRATRGNVPVTVTGKAA